MSEVRRDRTSGAWVIVAPERGHRPHVDHGRWMAPAARTPFDPSCPFCPGNERLLPGIIEETPRHEPPGWSTRVVPNKYPALCPEAGPVPTHSSAGPVVAGYGYHEVIIETGQHDADLATLSEPDLSAVARTYRHRYRELAAQPAIRSVLLFRNHGRGGGASLAHPHSQVIASALTAPRLAAASVWARSQYERTGRCVTCEQIELEFRDGRRLIEATARFVLLVPFAAASPFELWLLPKRHQASFAQIDDEELIEFGRLLQRALYRLKSVFDNPPYKYAIESGAAEDANANCTHWHLRIVPDLVTPGGFELGAGLPINPSRPEEDAEVLRAAAVPATENSR